MTPPVSKMTQTSRLNVHALERGDPQGTPVILLQGNVSTGRFYRNTLLALPSGFYGLAPDLRGFGKTEPRPIDATRGMRDFSDDLWSLIQAKGLEGTKVHLVGWSTGGAIAMQFAIDHPDAVRSLVLESAPSPYGFGGTKDLDGTPVWPDFAASGGGTANPDFVKRLAAKDRSAEADTSPRKVMNAVYFKPPFRSPEEEAFVDELLTTRVGDDWYPGDMTTSPNWPGVAPGTKGINNALSPKFMNVSAFANIPAHPDVLWIRGAEDQIISDTSLLDFGFLGQLGVIPGWPGKDVFPPQPMVSQLRATLDRYAKNGGKYWEEVFGDCGHSPHLEHADAFQKRVFSFLADRS